MATDPNAPNPSRVADLRAACLGLQAAFAADLTMVDDSVIAHTQVLASSAELILDLIAESRSSAGALPRSARATPPRNPREQRLLMDALNRLVHPAADDTDLDHAQRVLSLIGRRLP